MTNLATNLTTTAAKYPEQAALRVNGQGITYAQLHGMAAKVAGALRANGIQPGDRVAIILPNVPAFPVVYWGILLAGGIVVPMNPLLKAGEIDYFFTDSGAKIAFVWPDFVAEATKGAANSGTRIIECGPIGPVEGALEGGEPIAEPHERADDDTAIILYTSGTTGRPKGAELTHRNIHLNADRARAPRSRRSPPTTSSWAACRSSTSSGWSSASTPRPSRVRASPSSPASTRRRRSRSSRRSGSRSCRACPRCTPRSSTTRSPTAWTPPRCASAPPAGRRCRSR